MGLKVAFISPPSVSQVHIQQILEKDGRFRVVSFLSLDSLKKEFAKSGCQSLVIAVEELTELHFSVLEKVRQHFPQAGVFFVCQHLREELRFRFRKYHQVAALHLPTELEDLGDTLVRHYKNPHLPARLHVRAVRSDVIEVFQDDDKRVLHGRFLDFGKMGAKVQLPPGSLQLNSQIVIQYISSSQQRFQRIIAKVVWVRDENGWLTSFKGYEIYGVKFIAIA